MTESLTTLRQPTGMSQLRHLTIYYVTTLWANAAGLDYKRDPLAWSLQTYGT